MKKIILFLMLVALSGCPFSSDEFLGFVYPDKTNLTKHKVIGSYKSLDECLAAVNKAAGENGSYECGKNCDKSKMPMICEETIGNEK